MFVCFFCAYGWLPRLLDIVQLHGNGTILLHWDHYMFDTKKIHIWVSERVNVVQPFVYSCVYYMLLYHATVAIAMYIFSLSLLSTLKHIQYASKTHNINEHNT